MADPVNFTRPAAERISRVVRTVEFGTRDGGGPIYDRPWYGDPGLTLKLGTFTGNWDRDTFATVTLHGSTQTASVYNWCNSAVGADTANTTQSRYVIFGRVFGTQSAIEIQLEPPTSSDCTGVMTLGSLDLRTLPGYDEGVIQLLGHSQQKTSVTACDDNACLQWYSITTCSTAA